MAVFIVQEAAGGGKTNPPNSLPCGTLHQVPGVGIEPTWDFSRGILSPLRLPFRHPGRTTIILRSDCSLPEGHDRLPHPNPASRFRSGQGRGTPTMEMHPPWRSLNEM